VAPSSRCAHERERCHRRGAPVFRSPGMTCSVRSDGWVVVVVQPVFVVARGSGIGFGHRD